MKKGFTLIELLVVVLIIGILAAIALPQYQKAVLKSKNIQLKTVVMSLARAQEEYVLANGRCADSFDELSVSVPWGNTSVNSCFLTHTGDDAMRGTDDFYVVLNNTSDSCSIKAVWKTGKYPCTGFSYYLKHASAPISRLTCVEFTDGEIGRFCEKIEQATEYVVGSGWNIFFLP